MNETYRFVYGLFNDAISTSDYAALNCTMKWEVCVHAVMPNFRRDCAEPSRVQRRLGTGFERGTFRIWSM